MCAPVCMEATGQCQGSCLKSFFILFFETGSFTEPGAYQLARLSGQWVPGIPLSLPPPNNAAVTDKAKAPTFVWVPRIWIRVLKLVRQAFYRLNHLPVSLFSLFACWTTDLVGAEAAPLDHGSERLVLIIQQLKVISSATKAALIPTSPESVWPRVPRCTHRVDQPFRPCLELWTRPLLGGPLSGGGYRLAVQRGSGQ